MSGAVQTARDRAIADAKDLPSLINNVSAVDPALASQLTGKALLASKTPWGTIAGGVVGWLVSHYGLGWDQATCDVVAGACVLLASYAMRYVTAAPITGVVSAPKP